MGLEGYCDKCDAEMNGWGEHHKTGALLCHKCRDFLEDNEGVTGKLVVEKCKCCGHIKRAWFQKYMKRGPKAGSQKGKKRRPKVKKNRLLEEF